jgi:hypothetical protein
MELHQGLRCVCFHKCLQIHYYELVNNLFAYICESVIAWCPTKLELFGRTSMIAIKFPFQVLFSICFK